MRETKAQIMQGVPHIRARVVANNTVKYLALDWATVIRLHHTDIVRINADGSKTLCTGGWTTVTTKQRLNQFLGKDGYVYQKKHLWYFNGEPFFEGMIVKDGKILNPKVKPLW